MKGKLAQPGHTCIVFAAKPLVDKRDLSLAKLIADSKDPRTHTLQHIIEQGKAAKRAARQRARQRAQLRAQQRAAE